jgi:hypothetical protein
MERSAPPYASPRRPAGQATTDPIWRSAGDARAHPLPWRPRHLLIYCTRGAYRTSAVINADRCPDETVLLDLDRKAVCTRCGMIGADVRPNWSERPPPETLTGAQWRQP